MRSSQGQTSEDAPETQIRFGIARTTEFRLGVPNYNWMPGGSGFSDLQLGVKEQLVDTAGGFDLSVIAFLSLPTGSKAISSHGYDPALQAPWSKKLSDKWTAAGMFSVYWPTENGERNVTGEGTFLFDRQLTEPMDAFLEYAGDFPQRGRPRNLLHFGAAYKLKTRSQLDFHVGIGLSTAAMEHFIGGGYSFRFPAFRR